MSLIIGICGNKGSGKDTAAKILQRDAGGEKRVHITSFAAPIKAICQSLFGWSDETLYGPSELRERQDENFPRTKEAALYGGPEFLTPRYALQQLGTEFGRRMYENLWVDIALANAHLWLDGGLTPRPPMRRPFRCVVITDVRFQNEVNAIRADGGVIVKVVRDGFEGDGHASETELKGITPDMTLHNKAKSAGQFEHDAHCFWRGALDLDRKHGTPV